MTPHMLSEMRFFRVIVVPAKAGIHGCAGRDVTILTESVEQWIPAFAGTTGIL